MNNLFLRGFLPFFFACGVLTRLFSQPVLLDGVVNHFTKVTSLDTCPTRLTVENANPFFVNETVLLIQMKGATINEGNSSAFGSVNSLGSAGLFEKSTIDSIAGNFIFLNTKLVNKYNVAGAVQLVSFPHYEAAVIEGSLFAPPWNGKEGGILAISAKKLTMNDNIFAWTRGFRGGKMTQNQANGCTNFTQADAWFYDLNNWRGAQKGEGVADWPLNKEAGRGTLANGGGGGNDHNSGGGGGGHLVAGGKGGNNDEPGAFNCDGFFPGAGGRSLGTASLNGRLFLGGGGGGGHANNNKGSTGAAGGAIVILVVDTLVANSHTIYCRGGSPDQTSGGDGAGGAGAGGSVYLDVKKLSGVLTIHANGGKGGNTNNQNDNRCFGPGGGGAGGRIVTNLVGHPSLVVDVVGGQPGVVVNSSAPCNGKSNGAEKGKDGSVEPLFPIAVGDGWVPPAVLGFQIPGSLCEGWQAFLSVSVFGKNLSFQWQMDSGQGFQDLAPSADYTGETTTQLKINAMTPMFGSAQFRLRVTTPCFPEIFSPEISLPFEANPVADFDFTLAGNTVAFQNLSQNAGTYLWNFGDGATSILKNPTHTYAPNANYTVTLTVENGCSVASSIQILTLLTPPTAAFSVSATAGCAPMTVNFSNHSSANASSLFWEFPGGSPAISTSPNPVVTYSSPGLFDAKLTASNPAGSSLFEKTALISVGAAPVADFTFSVSGNSLTLQNNSANFTDLIWNFGDGGLSTLLNPTHTYAADGNYFVNLSILGPCGEATMTLPVVIATLPTAGFSSGTSVGCVPMVVPFTNSSSVNASSFQWFFPGGQPAFSGLKNPVVTYAVPGVFDVTLIVSSAAGSDTLQKTALVKVNAKPSVSFDFSVTGKTIMLQNNSANFNSLLWNFGDGTTSTASMPTHTYAGDGAYILFLQAQNGCGQANASQQVVIATPPAAGFTVAGSMGCSPLTVQFSNKSSANAQNYLWLFPGGEPATSSLKNPQVIYPNSGVFDAQLIVTNPTGTDTLLLKNLITVLGKPTADFSAQILGSELLLQNNSIGGASYAWDFGDGQTATGLAPAHSYAQEGEFMVTLTAQNPCGSASTSTTLSNFTVPQAAFDVFPKKGCAPLEVDFVNLSTENAKSFAWIFPAGSPAFSTAMHPTVTFTAPGSYDVRLVVTNPAGADTLFLPGLVEVNTLPTVDFSFLTSGLALTLQNNCVGATDFNWNFGDGSQHTNDANPAPHIYPSEGPYVVTLVAANECGSVTASQTITVSLTGVGNLEDELGLKIFPNPTNGLLFLDFLEKTDGEGEAVLLDISQKIRSRWSLGAGSHFEMDLAALPVGIYFLKISVGGKSGVAKVVKLN